MALTANALEGDRERCLSVGMNDYGSKRVGLKDLIEVLAAAPRLVAVDDFDGFDRSDAVAPARRSLIRPRSTGFRDNRSV